MAIERIIAWCTTERALLQQQLKLMESNNMHTTLKRDGCVVDITAETLEDVRRKIAQLDSLLA